jgi:hypothetical protein
MRRRILHKFKLTEISAVDRPAQAHAKAVIMKRADIDDDEDDLDIVDIAKALVEEGVNHGATKGEFETAISKGAAAAFPGVSSAQAVTKYVTTNETGKLLLKAAREATTVAQAAQDFRAATKGLRPGRRGTESACTVDGKGKEHQSRAGLFNTVHRPVPC